MSRYMDWLQYYRNRPLLFPEQGIKIQLPIVIACGVLRLTGKGKAGICGGVIELFYILIRMLSKLIE